MNYTAVSLLINILGACFAGSQLAYMLDCVRGLRTPTANIRFRFIFTILSFIIPLALPLETYNITWSIVLFIVIAALTSRKLGYPSHKQHNIQTGASK